MHGSYRCFTEAILGLKGCLNVRGWRAVLARMLVVVFAMTCVMGHAAAAEGQTETALDQQKVDFNIPQQPLSSALHVFAGNTGWEVSSPADLTEGKVSHGIAGAATPEDGLKALLAGTGLTYRIIGLKTVTIERETSSGIVPGIVGAGTAGVAADAMAGAGSENGVSASPQKPVKVPEILVKDVRNRETAELDNLPPEYAGGDVARGGRVGILGNKDIMDTPFTQMNYTSKLVQDQQARFLNDVLRNDPSVQLNLPSASGFASSPTIRGFQVNANDILFNSFAIAPISGTVMTEFVERVEVLRGPNALLNGAAPFGSIGGMINLVPKRAGDEALTQLTGQYISDTQVGGHADIGRRFGSNKQFGVRINGVYRTGDLPIDHASRQSALATVGLDYRGDIFRLTADFGYQEQEIQGPRRPFLVANGVTAMPVPPDTRTNAAQPWEFVHSRALYGTFRGEVDMTKYITGFAGFGITDNRFQNILSNRQITNAQGALAAANNALNVRMFDTQILTFDAGVRGAFDTGPIHHQAVAAYTWYTRQLRVGRGGNANLPASNLYNPVFAPAPPSSILANANYGDGRKENETDLSSFMLGDTLSVLDERVQLTGGVRFQQIKATNFNPTTSAVTDQYDKSAPTPMLGLVVKPWQHVSLYANYIQALQQGPTAPTTAVNAGEVFAPFVSKGYEAGVKVDFGRLATTLAVYQITQPNAFINPATNVFGVDGEQRNRGVELSVFGEVMDGLRLLGGTSYIDAELTKTQGGVNEGNKAPIFPFQFVLYGEWDTPFFKGFTLTSRVTHASSQYINLANSQRIREWTQWDLGARYRFERANGKPITIRANLDNALDTNAWYGAALAGQVFVRDPRTFLLSATFDF
ncbi:Ferrichrome-iron receptor [Nitrospira sp. KM1]|nr:Ferrichrome-iron receptor [Nitrospira sp. KM1]